MAWVTEKSPGGRSCLTRLGQGQTDTDPTVIKRPARANTPEEEGQMLPEARAGAGMSFAFSSVFFGKMFPSQALADSP